MNGFEIVPHTADVRLKANGGSLAELFTSALFGMNEILKPGFCRSIEGLTEQAEIKISSPDATALLIDFLSEVLTLTHERRALFCKAEFEKLEEQELTAKIFGKSVGEEGFEEDIKSVTYHEANIVKNEQGNYETVIVFDI